MLETAAYTDKARRDHNEDAYLIDDELGLYVVADGVGGLSAGEVASQIVCQQLRQHVEAGQSLEQAVTAAHGSIDKAVQRGEGKSGMASTVVVAQLQKHQWQLAWVGDSRIYVWDGELKQLSKDHSYVESLYDAGQISLEETETHPRKNVITQAIGGNRESVDVTQNVLALAAGQVLLLCSDGLSGEIDGALMIAQLSSGKDVSAVAKGLVRAAYDAGGKDNITCIVIRVAEDLENLSEVAPVSAQVYRVYDQVLGRFVGINNTADAVDNATVTDGSVALLDDRDDADQTAIIRAAPKQADATTSKKMAQNDGIPFKLSYYWFAAALVIAFAVIVFYQ